MRSQHVVWQIFFFSVSLSSRCVPSGAELCTTSHNSLRAVPVHLICFPPHLLFQGMGNMLPLRWVAVAKMGWETVVFLLAGLPQASQELLYLWPSPGRRAVPGTRGCWAGCLQSGGFPLQVWFGPAAISLPTAPCLYSLEMQAWKLIPASQTLKQNLHSLETKAGETLREFKGRVEFCCRNNPQMETAWLDGERVLPASTDGCTLINPLAWANSSIIYIGAIYTSLTLE